MQNQVRFCQAFTAAANSFGLNGVTRFPETRSIDENHRNPLNIRHLLNRIAGGARNR